MASSSGNRFPIRFDRLYGALSTALFMSPSKSYVEIGADQVHVRMGWGFKTDFPKAAVKVVSKYEKNPISRGVHGFGGRWLVNGSGEGIVAVDLEPVQRGYVMGFPVKLRQLLVSMEDAEGLMQALHPGRS